MQQNPSPITKIVKQCLPAVVSIVITKYRENLQMSLGLSSGLGNYLQVPHKKKIKIGGGSGFFVDKEGTILTNRHVISDSLADYTVILNNGQSYPAKVLIKDPINDTAILKIESQEDFPYLELGDTSKIELGQTVIAIGNALGVFRNTVSVGVISGMSRNITAGSILTGEKARLRGLIQTDAAVNPGNSGGPLIDLEGKVIGINAAMVFGAENISFALPINGPKKDLEDFKRYGKIIRPFLGVRYILLNKDLQEQWSLPRDSGALIISEPQGEAIIPNSPAQKAGLREYDIILEADGKKIDSNNSLTDILLGVKVGKRIPLKILRKKKEKIVMVTIGERL